jgi:hypothetical protein
VYCRPKRGWICRPHLHVPVLDWLRDEDHALCPVQLAVGRSAVVMPESFKAVPSDRHLGLIVQWGAENCIVVSFIRYTTASSTPWFVSCRHACKRDKCD